MIVMRSAIKVTRISLQNMGYIIGYLPAMWIIDLWDVGKNATWRGKNISHQGWFSGFKGSLFFLFPGYFKVTYLGGGVWGGGFAFCETKPHDWEWVGLEQIRISPISPIAKWWFCSETRPEVSLNFGITENTAKHGFIASWDHTPSIARISTLILELGGGSSSGAKNTMGFL